MKRHILLGLLMGFLLSTIDAQNYQLQNGGFEEWGNFATSATPPVAYSEPLHWHSFMSSIGGLYAFLLQRNQMAQSSDHRPGSTGTSSVKCWGKSLAEYGYPDYHVAGMITNGQPYIESMSSVGNRTIITDPNYNQPLNGKPDSLYFWAKINFVNSSQTARIRAFIHDNHELQDRVTEMQYVASSIQYTFAQPNPVWTKYTVPFGVYNSAITPAFILISMTTNSVANAGNDLDTLYLDDIELIYNRRISTLKLDDVNLSGFNPDITTYNKSICLENPLSPMPVVSATAASPNATLSINQATTANPNATITVTHGGATKVYTVHFNVHYGGSATISANICQGDTYQANGFFVQTSTPGLIQTQRHITTLYGCDSTVFLNLQVNPTYTITLRDTICQQTAYNNHGFSLTTQETSASGNITRIRNLISIHDCDSIVTLMLQVNPANITTLNDRVCQNNSYNNYGFNIPAADLQQVDTLSQMAHFTNRFGCDSTVILNLFIDPIYHFDYYDQICLGGTYNSHGFDLSNNHASGTFIYTHQYISMRGCDSTIVLHLTVNNLKTKHIADEVCSGTAYQNNGFTYSSALTATKTSIADTLHLVTAQGCDSMITLLLTIHPVKTTVLLDTVCQNIGYQEHGFTITTAQTAAVGTIHQQNIFNTTKGCDSIVTLDLTVIPTSATIIYDTICSNHGQYQNWDFNVPNTPSGTHSYTRTLTAVNGCDSTATLYLTVNKVYADTLAFTLCGTSEYHFYDKIYTAAGVYDTVFHSVKDCDSTIVLVLSHGNQYRQNIYAAICEGEVYAENGFNKNTSGTDSITYNSVNGCDSVVILHLTVNLKQTMPTFYHSACDQYTWEGTIYTASGVYTKDYLNQYHCDSLLSMDLTILHSSPITEISDTIRGGFIYQNNGFTIQPPHVSAPILDTLFLQNTAGCDSVVALHLTVLPTISTTFPNYFCERDSYIWQDNEYFEEQIFVDTIYTDTATYIYINEWIANNSPLTEFEVNSCDPYSWNGQVYSTTNDYVQEFSLTNGCDSVVTLHFTRLVPNTPAPAYDTVCQGEAFANSYFTLPPDSLTTPGMHHFTKEITTNEFTCPTTIEAFIMVNATYHSTETIDTCSNIGYDWRGQHYSQSGTYYKSFMTDSGCDSVFQLELTIHQPYHFVAQQSLCENNIFIWRGQTVEQTGTYYDSLQTVHGCDSIYELQAIVNPSFSDTISSQIYEGRQLVWEGNTLNVAGFYSMHYASMYDCDSSIYLNLSVMPIPVEDFYENICEGDSILWGEEYYSEMGNYSYLTDSIENPVYKLLHLTVYSPSYTNFDTISFVGDAFSYEGFHITTDITQQIGEYIYQRVLTNLYGCDSIITLHLVVNGISESNYAQIRIFPNPTNSVIHIINDENANLESVKIYDLLGRLVEERMKINNSHLTISVVKWSKGLYTIRIQTQNGISIQKMVVE